MTLRTCGCLQLAIEDPNYRAFSSWRYFFFASPMVTFRDETLQFMINLACKGKPTIPQAWDKKIRVGLEWDRSSCRSSCMSLTSTDPSAYMITATINEEQGTLYLPESKTASRLTNSTDFIVELNSWSCSIYKPHPVSVGGAWDWTFWVSAHRSVQYVSFRSQIAQLVNVRYCAML